MRRAAMPVAEEPQDVLTADEAMQVIQDLLVKNELKLAGEMLEHLVEELPDHIVAWNYLGVVRFHTDGPKAAAAVFRKAATIAPDDARVQNNLGNAMMETGDIEAATVAYQKAISLDPNLGDSYANLASIMKFGNQVDAAEVLLRKAVEVNPKFGLALNNLAHLLLETKRPREALQYFWKATVYLPERAHPRPFVAMAYWHAGMIEEAKDFVRKWLAEKPGDPQARHMTAAITQENVPDRAEDRYVTDLFDNFASSFDAKLDDLGYRAPEIVGAAVAAAVGEPNGDLAILDAGCGTGKCARYLKPFADTLDGVDLSNGMLSRARKLEAYDRLECEELTKFLQNAPAAYDVIASADTLCYFGALEDFADAAAKSLKSRGILVFTVEDMKSDERNYSMSANGRYTHSECYVKDVLEKAGFQIISMPRDTLRNENIEPVVGIVVTARIA